MKTFLRALHFCYPYRSRLLLSVACAACAAVLWGLNFTAVYPVLKILGSGQNLQAWVHQRLAAAEHAAPAERYRYQLAAYVVDDWLPTDRFATLAWLIGLVVLGTAVKGAFEYGQEALVGGVVNRGLFALRNRLYRHALRLDGDRGGGEGTGEVMARLTHDTEVLGHAQKTLFGKLVSEPLRAASCVCLALWISWQLTLLFLVAVPLFGYLLTRVGRLMKRATRRLLQRMSHLYKLLQESLPGVRVIQAFTGEAYERRRFREATREYFRRAMRVVHLDAASGPVVEVLGVVTVAAALLVGAYLVLNRRTHLFGLRLTARPLEPEALLQLYVLLAAIADPVRKLSSVYTRLQAGAAAADRLFAFADRVPKVGGNRAGHRLARHRRAVEFRDVWFAYEAGRPALSDVNLTVPFGESVALVGRNGSGKTTLVGLLARFYDPDGGAVLVDGHDLRHVNLRSLRRQIGLVSQETVLFDDTIARNLAYGKRHATPAEIEEAARAAFAHDFIVRLPHGYQTRVGEAGAKLSGGQRQRLALARAILRDPAILILDEFTSQFDPESEALLHLALKEFIRDRTTFLITHRPTTLDLADRVVVLDGGRIVADGAPEELRWHEALRVGA